ncbi:MAG: TetR/AcrR family transcriptional regulator [Paludibacterium sp.]|uniref:TetR/AcrR family transcriptional regulator n=1 Tax=Paludibacterium sp. TaxID=1917523 RepID=UPI0025FE29BD|nr:TetR/AcrR family transcriptional regulator [Paludibacterium sp.]MBV8046366.1 TetR/AcrR family transcriptional regulator [Paludibacterium sp.]MBV8645807.1 TetR/AcrR family transcriptional regulator [Paludibacterium sp.]
MKIDTDAKNDTRKRIMDIAEELLLTRGFNAFSYQWVSSELGVRNAAIHYHFPHKTDLGVALIERYRRRLSRFIEAQAALPPREQLERYFELAHSYFRQDRQVCPSGMLCTEFHTLPDAMRDQAAAFIGEMRDWSIDLAARGRDLGVFHYPGSAEEMGVLMFSALQGGLQLARVDDGWLDTVKRQITRLLGVE